MKCLAPSRQSTKVTFPFAPAKTQGTFFTWKWNFIKLENKRAAPGKVLEGGYFHSVFCLVKDPTEREIPGSVWLRLGQHLLRRVGLGNVLPLRNSLVDLGRVSADGPAGASRCVAKGQKELAKEADGSWRARGSLQKTARPGSAEGCPRAVGACRSRPFHVASGSGFVWVPLLGLLPSLQLHWSRS